MIQQVSFLQFCMVVLGISALLQTNTLGTARISQTVTSLTAAPLFYIAWNYYFRPCPALKQVPFDETKWTVGFYSVQETLKRIWKTTSPSRVCDEHSTTSYLSHAQQQHQHQYHQQRRPLPWLLASIVVSEAASQALVAIATTYMTTILKMSAHAIGIVFLAVLVSGIGGAKLGAVVATRAATAGNVNVNVNDNKYSTVSSTVTTTNTTDGHPHQQQQQQQPQQPTADPVRSAMLAQLYFCVVTTTACLVLNGPQDQNYVYMFGALWGVALGWTSPMHASAYMGLVQDKPAQAELMGIYLLAANVLSWLPALVFTVLNEAGADMKWGMASLNVYFLVGFGCLWKMGDFASAVAMMSTVDWNVDDDADGGGSGSSQEGDGEELVELQTKILPPVV